MNQENERHKETTDDIALVKARNLIEERDQQIDEKNREIKSLSQKLNWFEEQFNLLKSKHYGKSSEKQLLNQTQLFDEDEENVQNGQDDSGKETITYARKKPQRHPKNLDTSYLPREKQYLDLTDEEKQCACGHGLEKFGEESREEIRWQPATLKVIEYIRPKYTCRHCETVKTAKAVELPLPKSKASASLIAEVMLNKYRFHLPFYRQSKMLAAYQLKVPDNTLAGWVMGGAEQLDPLMGALWKQLTLTRALQVDETPVKVLDPEKKGYMWLYHSYLPKQRFVIFDFNLSRSASVVDERLKDYQGLLQTDGYSGYHTQRRRQDIVSLGCWDHARRKFADVVKAAGNNKSGKAGKMLEKIAKLYDIEKAIKALPANERRAIRQQETKAKLASIQSFLTKINAPPKSLLGVAVTYCKNQWDDLVRYVNYGEAQISNCWVENQVRPFAVGKRNWLFVGNEASAKKAALIYSLIQSCELNNIDPRLYLEYVLSQVHRMRRQEVDPSTLLPHTIDPKLLKPG